MVRIYYASTFSFLTSFIVITLWASKNLEVLCIIGELDKYFIIKSEATIFSDRNGLEFQEFEVFQKSDPIDGKVTFESLDNSDFKVVVTKNSSELYNLVIVEATSTSDAIQLCYVNTYIVFRPIHNYINHYTAHIAHVRDIDEGQPPSVEWDLFFSHPHDFSGRFVSAFSPDNEKLDTSEKQSGRAVRLKSQITKSVGQEIGHNVSDAEASIFKGIGRCQQETTVPVPLSNISDGVTLAREQVVQTVLNILQVHCLRNFFEQTSNLFTKNLVSISPGQGIRVPLNKSHPLLRRQLLSETDWTDLVSAIFLHTFTHAYLQELWLQQQIYIEFYHYDISLSIRTLTTMTAKIVHLVKKQPLKRHFVKIITTLLISLQASGQYFLNEMDSVEGCVDCSGSQLLYTNNLKRISSLTKLLQCQIVKVLKTNENVDIFLRDYVKNVNY